MSKLTVLEEHLASMQMNYNAKHLDMPMQKRIDYLETIEGLRKTIETLKMPNGKEDFSNTKVRPEEVDTLKFLVQRFLENLDFAGSDDSVRKKLLEILVSNLKKEINFLEEKLLSGHPELNRLKNIEVHFEEVKPDSKNILTKLFKSFKN